MSICEWFFGKKEPSNAVTTVRVPFPEEGYWDEYYAREEQRKKEQRAKLAAENKLVIQNVAVLNEQAKMKALTYSPIISLSSGPRVFIERVDDQECFIPLEYITDISATPNGDFVVRYSSYGSVHMSGGISQITMTLVSGVTHEIRIENACVDILLSALRNLWKNGGVVECN